MKIRKILHIIFVILFLPLTSYAKIHITTTITPIASLAAMIGGDKCEISVIHTTIGCPHSYFLKPSDLSKMELADLFIYIDENFDSFSESLLNKFDKNSIKISSIKNIKIYNNNLHLWLLPHNANVIMNAIYKEIVKISPEDKNYFHERLKSSISKIDELENLRKTLNGVDIILLSDSAEYLFHNITGVKTSFEFLEYSSIKSTENLKNIAKNPKKCFVISQHQGVEKYQKLLGNKVAALLTENWELSSDLENLYIKNYESIITQINSICLKP